MLDTDVLDTGILAVLSQMQHWVKRIIAYASKTLNRTQKKYFTTTTKKDLLAVVAFFVQHFRHYLHGQKFWIHTDDASLIWLRNFNMQRLCWFGGFQSWRLMTTSWSIGREVKHMNADVMSRRASLKCKRPSCRECGDDVLFLGRDSEDPQHNK